MAAERQEALREFVAVTGTEEDRARFFLESAGWDLQVMPRGGLRRAGWGYRARAPGASSLWRLKRTVISPGRSPTQALGACVRFPRVASSPWSWEDTGQPRPRRALPAFSFHSSSPVRWARETLGTATTRVEWGSWGRGGLAESRMEAGPERPALERSGAGDEVVVYLRFCRLTAGGGRSRSKDLAHACSHLIAGRTTPGLATRGWSLFIFLSYLMCKMGVSWR